MSRHAVLRKLVHLPGTYLHLQGLRARPYHGSMKGLIHIILGIGYIVVELPRNGFPKGVHDPQNGIAFHYGIYDNPYCQKIIKLIHRKVFPAHFFVDAVKMLCPAGDVHIYSRLDDFLLKNIDGFLYDILPFGKFFLYSSTNFIIGIGIKSPIGKIFEFLFNMVNPQAVCQRSVNLLGFPGDTHLFLLGKHSKGTHIVEAIRKLDKHHPNILGHNEKHLAQIFRLVVLQGLKMDSPQLGYSAHQKGHVFAEPLRQLLLRDGSILQHIVQQRRGKGFRIHTYIRQNRSHQKRMHDVRLSGVTKLLSVSM